MRASSVALLAVLLVALVGCDLPRDMDGTLERVTGGTLRVGVAGRSPWARMAGEHGEGVEAALVRRAARSLDARVRWAAGHADDLFAALERGHLDVVVGGLTEDTPWRDRVGLTRPYAEVRLLVAGPPWAHGVEELDERVVAVEAPLAAALVERQGGRAAPPDSPADLVALPDWRLEGRDDLAPTQVVLRVERHVMATAPGENAWLLWLDRFLQAHAGDVPALLREEAARAEGAARGEDAARGEEAAR